MSAILRYYELPSILRYYELPSLAHLDDDGAVVVLNYCLIRLNTPSAVVFSPRCPAVYYPKNTPSRALVLLAQDGEERCRREKFTPERLAFKEPFSACLPSCLPSWGEEVRRVQNNLLSRLAGHLRIWADECYERGHPAPYQAHLWDFHTGVTINAPERRGGVWVSAAACVAPAPDPLA